MIEFHRWYVASLIGPRRSIVAKVIALILQSRGLGMSLSTAFEVLHVTEAVSKSSDFFPVGVEEREG